MFSMDNQKAGFGRKPPFVADNLEPDGACCPVRNVLQRLNAVA